MAFGKDDLADLSVLSVDPDSDFSSSLIEDRENDDLFESKSLSFEPVNKDNDEIAKKMADLNMDASNDKENENEVTILKKREKKRVSETNVAQKLIAFTATTKPNTTFTVTTTTNNNNNAGRETNCVDGVCIGNDTTTSMSERKGIYDRGGDEDEDDEEVEEIVEEEDTNLLGLKMNDVAAATAAAAAATAAIEQHRQQILMKLLRTIVYDSMLSDQDKILSVKFIRDEQQLVMKLLRTIVYDDMLSDQKKIVMIAKLIRDDDDDISDSDTKDNNDTSNKNTERSRSVVARINNNSNELQIRSLRQVVDLPFGDGISPNGDKFHVEETPKTQKKTGNKTSAQGKTAPQTQLAKDFVDNGEYSAEFLNIRRAFTGLIHPTCRRAGTCVADEMCNDKKFIFPGIVNQMEFTDVHQKYIKICAKMAFEVIATVISDIQETEGKTGPKKIDTALLKSLAQAGIMATVGGGSIGTAKAITNSRKRDIKFQYKHRDFAVVMYRVLLCFKYIVAGPLYTQYDNTDGNGLYCRGCKNLIIDTGASDYSARKWNTEMQQHFECVSKQPVFEAVNIMILRLENRSDPVINSYKKFFLTQLSELHKLLLPRDKYPDPDDEPEGTTEPCCRPFSTWFTKQLEPCLILAINITHPGGPLPKPPEVQLETPVVAATSVRKKGGSGQAQTGQVTQTCNSKVTFDSAVSCQTLTGPIESKSTPLL